MKRRILWALAFSVIGMLMLPSCKGELLDAQYPEKENAGSISPSGETVAIDIDYVRTKLSIPSYRRFVRYRVVADGEELGLGYCPTYSGREYISIPSNTSGKTRSVEISLSKTEDYYDCDDLGVVESTPSWSEWECVLTGTQASLSGEEAQSVERIHEMDLVMTIGESRFLLEGDSNTMDAFKEHVYIVTSSGDEFAKDFSLSHRYDVEGIVTEFTPSLPVHGFLGNYSGSGLYYFNGFNNGYLCLSAGGFYGQWATPIGYVKSDERKVFDTMLGEVRKDSSRSVIFTLE